MSTEIAVLEELSNIDQTFMLRLRNPSHLTSHHNKMMTLNLLFMRTVLLL